MIKLWNFRIYTGTKNWGWTMYGFGYTYKWFFGFTKLDSKGKFIESK